MNDFFGIKNYPEVIRTSKIEIPYCEWFDEKSNIWCFDLHNHPSVIEMMFFRQGNARVNILSQTHYISYFDLIIYPAGMYHKEALMITESQDVICIRIRIGDGINFNAPIHIKDQDQTLNWLFKRIYHECKKQDGSISLAEDYTRLMLLYCYTCHSEVMHDTEFLDKVSAYLNEHFCEQISIPVLAEMVHVSESYLSKAFKKRTGKTIIHYVLDLRIDMAKQMLSTTTYSIETISDSLGFSSPKYFSRVFGKSTGETPSNFRLRTK